MSQQTYTRNGKTFNVARIDFTGTWSNDLDSEMTLQLDENKVTGKYKTAVGQPSKSEEFDLVGWAFGDQITFTVDFSKYGSITAWVGQHTFHTGEEVIHTLWHLTQNIPDAKEKEWLWSGIKAGANQFRRKQ
jgi:Avidin family